MKKKHFIVFTLLLAIIVNTATGFRNYTPNKNSRKILKKSHPKSNPNDTYLPLILEPVFYTTYESNAAINKQKTEAFQLTKPPRRSSKGSHSKYRINSQTEGHCGLIL